ncbi:MAG: hypothetical protein AAFX51_04525, partial [Cyanobacteria bacterium J06636_28]
GVVRAVAMMSMDQSAKPRWRYWEAMALIRSGQRDAGLSLMAELANDRSYHGFLAADFVDALPFGAQAIGGDQRLVHGDWAVVEAVGLVDEVGRQEAVIAPIVGKLSHQ